MESIKITKIVTKHTRCHHRKTGSTLTSIHTYTHARKRTHAHTYTYTHIHTHIHTYILNTKYTYINSQVTSGIISRFPAKDLAMSDLWSSVNKDKTSQWPASNGSLYKRTNDIQLANLLSDCIKIDFSKQRHTISPQHEIITQEWLRTAVKFRTVPIMFNYDDR
jgi:hypothetical protein